LRHNLFEQYDTLEEPVWKAERKLPLGRNEGHPSNNPEGAGFLDWFSPFQPAEIKPRT